MVYAFFMDKINDIHIGSLIKAKMEEQGRKHTWLARQISCSPNHIYKIYNSHSIHTDLLVRISNVLEYNFFECFI